MFAKLELESRKTVIATETEKLKKEKEQEISTNH